MNPKTSVHIQNIVFSATEKDIIDLISEHIGEVETDILLPLHRNTKNNKGWCNIDFRDEKLANDFISKVNNTKFKERDITVQKLKYKPKNKKFSYGNKVNPKYSIHIGNIPKNWRNDDITNLIQTNYTIDNYVSMM